MNLPIWISTLLSYGVAQFAILLGAFIRIPFLTQSLGVDGYGLTLAVAGFGILVLALSDALTQAARAALAEGGAQRATIARAYSRFGARLSSALVFPLAIAAAVLTASMGVDSFVASVVACVACAALGISGATSKALLEVSDRTAVSHLTQASTSLVGVPLLLWALVASPSLVVACAVTGIGLALPYLFAWVLTAGVLRRVRQSERHSARLPKGFVWSRFSSMIAWTAATAASHGLDATIVSAFSGPQSAAEYGLASRIMALSMILSIGLSPLISSRLSRVRADHPDSLVPTMQKWAVFLLLGSIGLVLIAIAISSSLQSLLSGGQIRPSWSIYATLGLFAILSAVTTPLLAALTSTRLARSRARLSVVAAVVNLLVSVFSTMILGPVGPAIGSVVGLLALTIGAMALLRDRDAFMRLD